MHLAFTVSAPGRSQAHIPTYGMLGEGATFAPADAADMQTSALCGLTCLLVPVGLVALTGQSALRTRLNKRRMRRISILSMRNGPSTEEPSHTTRLSSINRLTEGLMTGTKTFYQQSLEIWPGNVTSWVMLGDAGGGVVNERVYDPRACAEKALSISSCASTAWLLLGKSGGGRVNGEFRPAALCFERSLSIDDTFAANWLALGTIGGGHVNGRKFTSNACFKLAHHLDPQCRTAWLFTPVAGEQREVSSHSANRNEETLESKNASILSHISSPGSRDENLALRQRLQAALQTDSVNAEAWYVLGSIGGAKVGKTCFSAAHCHEKALDCLSKNSFYNLNGLDDVVKPIIARQQVFAWCGLGSEGGGKVCGFSYDQQACHQMASEISHAMVDEWSQEQRRMKALREAPRNIEAVQEAIESSGQWFQLGLGLEGTRGEKACYELALEAEPRNCAAWQKLAELGGGCVGGQVFEGTECIENSRSMIFDDK
eukprot:TRINITY_DN77201_c0_g1_i1.p1 TRINITY_DN77201_c0_g1~~TRINITY_DN77201_c0_g1_i1.p1  ORF type:complete len:487 (-),score=72.25 TRINITY_DN77201_c0_g1_i1:57-1517(-)